MYQAHLLLQSDTDFTLEEAARRLRDRFPTFTVQAEPNLLTLASQDWEIHFQLNEGPEVLEDSARIAELVAGGDDGQELASISRRVEIGSEVPDPEMDHFDDYLTVLETMQTFKGVIAVDPTEPSLL